MGLPDDSETKKAMREGDWTEQQYLLARLINELAYFRADHAAVHANHKMRIDPIESPAQRSQRAQETKERHQIHSMLRAQLRGEYKPQARDVAFVHEDRAPELTQNGGPADG
jgi:hypothetical protein